MTHNQIAYWQLQEDRRANLAREGEAYRANRANEREVHRANVAREEETQRHNTATEQFNISSLQETSRHNLAQEQETNRHNVAQEKVSFGTLNETVRHNIKSEELQSVSNLNSAQANVIAKDRLDFDKVKESTRISEFDKTYSLSADKNQQGWATITSNTADNVADTVFGKSGIIPLAMGGTMLASATKAKKAYSAAKNTTKAGSSQFGFLIPQYVLELQKLSSIDPQKGQMVVK